MIRFLVMGLPRSGTTYLSTLINSHRHALCEGEQFNPFEIIGEGWRESGARNLTDRDTDPAGFLTRFWARQGGKPAAVGCKYMIGHHIEVLKYIESDPEIRLIYVHRENKLAQVISLVKAIETQKWAALHPGDRDEKTKVGLGPLQLLQRIREMEMQDYLFASWFGSLANARLSLEYHDLFSPGFEERLCAFLGLAFDRKMRSPLVKQGAADVLSNLERGRLVANYFRAIGKEGWFTD